MEAKGLSAERWREYVAVMSELHGLELSDDRVLEVVANLQRIEALVAPLLAFDLPATLEPAPLFQP